MLTLHLFRHGQTNYNAEHRVQGQFDSVLTETGKLQAAELQPLAESLDLKAIYSSSNVRAKHTAEIMTAGLPLEIECRDDLREIFMGSWQQRLWSEMKEAESEQCSYFISEPDRFCAEGAETFHELQSRGVGAVEEIISKEFSTDANRSVLIVSHGAILKTILAHYANVPLREMWTEPQLLNCSHSVIKVESSTERFVDSISGESLAGTIWA